MKLNLHVVQCAITVLSCQVSTDTLCQALNTVQEEGDLTFQGF